MEMRAREHTGMSQDLIPPIPPIATSLHDHFLHSHCSFCFRPLPSSPTHPINLHISSGSSQITPTDSNPSLPPPNCTACNASLLYCSRHCFDSDSDRHASSGECRLFLLLCLLDQSDASTWHPGDTADLRAALRLLHSFETLGFLPPPPRSDSSVRIGGLLASGLDEVLKEGSEMAERIREGGTLMSRAINSKRDESPVLEEELLWAVLTNAVEVQVGEGGALGIAVYGPWFSWFNHSCSPNACYRFELSSGFEPSNSCDSGLLRVLPVGDEEESAVWTTWICGENKLTHGLCRYGPRIIVRSIKPIKKGEEVCITYADLLQPKAMRHFNLWSKYRFVCCCERCTASPETYIDYILNCDAKNLNSNHESYRDAEYEKLADFLDQTIDKYMSDGSPEACCKKLENMLSEVFQDSLFQEEEPSKENFRLHPLHYLSFNAYITLASAYRILASNLLATGSGEDGISEAFKISRAAAAYSLLLAGATHHLFMSETSLIANTALFWVSAGESIMGVVRSSYEPEFSLVSDSQFTIREGSYVSLDECKETSIRFLKCISSNLIKSWPYLVQGFSYLENITSPVDFSWLGVENIHQTLPGSRGVTDFCVRAEYKFRVETCGEEERRGLFQLAVYCLTYGRYLAVICYGPRCYLADNVRNILHGIR